MGGRQLVIHSLPPETAKCPHCLRDLTYEANGAVYSKAYSVEVRGVYDGGLFYRDVEGCGMAWHRWKDDTGYGKGMRAKAQPYIDQVNEAVQQERLNNAFNERGA